MMSGEIEIHQVKAMCVSGWMGYIPMYARMMSGIATLTVIFKSAT
ncbi:MAG: hypothetical protein PHQ09_04675 [Actinomycetota bacterium]|nr:hypothetical protein [Actinomycetota bacterium]